MAEKKIVDETFTISTKRGNGVLRRELGADTRTGQVVRYNLAYINHSLCIKDNGRVIGYDNAHDGHHRHFWGVVEPIEFVSFEDVEQKFTDDWTALQKGRKK